MKNDTVMSQGEWHPVNIGGDPHPMEIKGITQTYYTSSLDISLLEGTLYRMNAGLNLWPRSSALPQFPWTYQHGLTFNPTTAKIISVYDDDGSVLL